MTNKKKVLITGCSGLVGTFAVSQFLRDNFKYEVVGVDLQDYPVKINSLYGDRFTFLKMDLTDTNNLIDLFESGNFDLVINLFGVKGSPMRAKNSPVDFLYPSLKINTEIINQCAKRNIWLVFVSSVGVYSPAERFVEEDVWKTLPSENDWYPSWSKRIGELLLESYKIQYGYDNWAIVRPANIFGDFDDFSGNGTVISSTVKKIWESDDEIDCWGDGSPIRDFVYGKDVAIAVKKIWENKIHDIINFGSGKEITIKEMVESLVKISGKDLKINWDTTKPSGDLKRLMDVTKQEKYDLLPSTDFNDALTKTYSYYTNQFKQNKIDLDIRKFLTEGGFYFGKTDKIINDRDEHLNVIHNTHKACETKDCFEYRYEYNLPDSFEGEKPIKKQHYEKSSIPKLEEFVRNANGFEIQKWWETTKYSQDLVDSRDYFQKLVEGFVFDLYPDLKDNILHQDAFTIYEEFDHITPHNDGENPSRYCVVLIYLSDENDYHDNGGKLVVSEFGKDFELNPVRNNFAMLDFTLNNPNHSVTPVSGDFKRITYIDFIYNKKMFNLQLAKENNKNNQEEKLI
jgi:GDP-L-fucose synthase